MSLLTRALRSLRGDRQPPAPIPRRTDYRRILVPMRLGDVGDEPVATAVAIAKESGAEVHAIEVVRVPRRFPVAGDLPPDIGARVEASLDRARGLGEANGVEVQADVVRTRSISHTIVQEAQGRRADLLVLGSSARWRRHERSFSPTVDYVLRHAPCEVLVVPFPEDGVEE